MECEGRKAWTSLTELRDGRSVLTTSGRYHLNVLRLSCRPLEGEQGVILGKAALDLPLSTIMGECSPGFKVKLEFWFVKSLLEAFFFYFGTRPIQTYCDGCNVLPLQSKLFQLFKHAKKQLIYIRPLKGNIASEQKTNSEQIALFAPKRNPNVFPL